MNSDYLPPNGPRAAVEKLNEEHRNLQLDERARIAEKAGMDIHGTFDRPPHTVSSRTLYLMPSDTKVDEFAMTLLGGRQVVEKLFAKVLVGEPGSKERAEALAPLTKASTVQYNR